MMFISPTPPIPGQRPIKPRRILIPVVIAQVEQIREDVEQKHGPFVQDRSRWKTIDCQRFDYLRIVAPVFHHNQFR
jgi:hypothetical protein